MKLLKSGGCLWLSDNLAHSNKKINEKTLQVFSHFSHHQVICLCFSYSSPGTSVYNFLDNFVSGLEPVLYSPLPRLILEESYLPKLFKMRARCHLGGPNLPLSCWKKFLCCSWWKKCTSCLVNRLRSPDRFLLIKSRDIHEPIINYFVYFYCFLFVWPQIRGSSIV